jgi:hypothetical protein
VEWPTHDGGYERRAFVLRAISEESRYVSLVSLELWSDQLATDEGGFWATRNEFDGYPQPLSGQSKSVWRWFAEVNDRKPSVMDLHEPDVKWFKLPEKK